MVGSCKHGRWSNAELNYYIYSVSKERLGLHSSQLSVPFTPPAQDSGILALMIMPGRKAKGGSIAG
jgi:hypothetical protein